MRLRDVKVGMTVDVSRASILTRAGGSISVWERTGTVTAITREDCRCGRCVEPDVVLWEGEDRLVVGRGSSNQARYHKPPTSEQADALAFEAERDAAFEAEREARRRTPEAVAARRRLYESLKAEFE